MTQARIRRIFILAAAVAAGHLPRPAAAAATPTADPRPNILFILSDDHGAQAIGAYGSNRNRTPAIDRLAHEGMRFANGFCGNSICAPSRATILTGLHSHVSGHTTNERIFDNRATTFPELLRDAGYRTALIGKWHLNVEPQGFDHWDVLIDQGTYYNPDMIRNGEFHKETGYTTDILTDLTIDWLKAPRDTESPFLLMCHHKAPHRAWEPALRHLRLFEDAPLPEPATLFDDWSHRSSAHTHAHMSIADDLWPGDLHLEPMSWLLTPEQEAVWDSFYVPRTKAFREASLSGDTLVRWKYQRYAKDYLRCVASLDEGIGRLLACLDSTGLARNTIVIYSSDQGWLLGEHGMFDKRWMYEESFRMPLIVRWPGVVKPGSVNTDLVQNVDFAPTLLEAARVPVPNTLQGRSLVPLLEGRRPPDWRRSLYYHFYEDRGAHTVPRHFGVRTDRYALMHFYRLHEWEMYDLEKDPLEVVSVADDATHRLARDSLESELRRLQTFYRVTAAADSEYDEFEDWRRTRWALLDSIGRMPPFGRFTVDTLATRRLAEHDELSVSYTIGGQAVPALLLVPRGGREPRPGVVLAHSGRSADSTAAGRSRHARGARSAAAELCRRGFVVIAPDRSGSSLLAQELAELWFAHAFLERLRGVHMLRVGVLGFGEGGDLALLLAALNPEVAAAVSIGGSDSVAISWGEVGRVVPLVQPRPFLAVGASPMRPSSWRAGDAWYGKHQMAERLAYVADPGLHGGESPESIEGAAVWLTRWLGGPQP